MNKLILFSPFRHRLFLNHYFFRQAEKILIGVVDRFNQKNTEMKINSPWVNDEEAGSKYISVKYDVLNLESKPVFTILLEPSLLRLLMKKECYSLIRENFEAIACKVDIYNTMIGIINIELKIKSSLKKENIDPVKLDIMTSMLSKEFEQIYLRGEIEQIIAELHGRMGRIIRFRGRSSIYKHTAFSRISHFISNEVDDLVLWTGRLLYVKAEEKKEWIPFFKNWAQTDIIENNNSAFFRSGNNLVLSTFAPERDVINILNLSQYYYSICYVINLVIKEVSSRFMCETRIRGNILNDCQMIDLAIQNIGVSYDEVIGGLQGKRKMIVQTVCESWGYADFVQMIEKRSQIIQKRVGNYYRYKQQRYNKILEILLTIVGMVAVSDFILNIVSYTKPSYIRKSDSLFGDFGILYFSSGFNGDVLISSSLLISILIALFYIKKS